MLKLKKQPLASVYGIIHRNRFYYYQSGYDPEWARRSVGLVLLGETLSDAFREGRTVFEWLRGTERYKSEWASGARETEAVRFIFPTAGGLAYLATLEGTTRAKSAIKSLAGDRVWKAARHWLKRRP
jgi:CelD/BcsL family acetyltransferase involved in cellulose biosynthesis